MILVKLKDPGEISSLLPADDYKTVTEEEED
jgi:hypothetical protein